MRTKVIQVVVKFHVPYDSKHLGSAGEAEKKVLAAKEALIKSGVVVTDFATSYTSVENGKSE